MRRKEREITSLSDLKEILEKADICRIAIGGSAIPYIVPLNFGFTWENNLEIFFHCASEGRKLDLLSKNNLVGFEIDIDHELITHNQADSKKACNWGMKYKSIIGTGKITEISDETGKKAALDKIMLHYGLLTEKLDYEKEIFNRTKILRLEVLEMTGKKRI